MDNTKLTKSKRFANCKDVNEYLDFFDNNEQSKRHTQYYHYTKLKNINNIFKTKKLFLTQGSEKNDKSENNMRLFSVCFSTGTSESLPLWYLYSGIDGKGGRIGMSKKVFLNLIEKPSFFLMHYEDKTFQAPIGEPRKLECGEYEFNCRDVLYIGEDAMHKNTYRAKYNGKVNNNISEDVYQAIKNVADNGNIVLKGLIWFYEKETRIQVKVKEELLADNSGIYTVAIDISDIFDSLCLRLAPEYDSDIDIDNYLGIKEWSQRKIEKSDYKGQIKMSLCDKCEKNKE